jgi:cytochrome c553
MGCTARTFRGSISPMRAFLAGALFAVAAASPLVVANTGGPVLQASRHSSKDLKLSGELAGGSVRFISRDELEKLPQVTVTVTNDANFNGSASISGVSLEALLHALHVVEKNTIVAAVCDDEYEAYYPDEYREAHHPLLVLRINGKPLDQVSRTADAGVYGPYLISYPNFQPRYHILSQEEEAEIPNGIVELRFLKQDDVLHSIAPHGDFSTDAPETKGYRIALQNCFRCHNVGSYGGHKGGRSWSSLGKVAKNDPNYFEAYIKDPQAEDANAQMPNYSKYDEATLHALTAYFQTFAPPKDAK